MSAELYELVFYGELVQGASLEKTKQQLAQLFKANDAQVEKMFSGQRVVLKSKLDAATAEKYLTALEARGASCKLEPAAQAVSGVPDFAPQQASSPSSPPSSVQSSMHEPSSNQPQSSSVVTKPADNSERMSLAGEKADALLASSELDIEPLGVDLGVKDEEAPPPELTMQDSLTIAPVGSDIGDKKEEVPAVVPDVSHLNLKD
jgi:hypothetical protein